MVAKGGAYGLIRRWLTIMAAALADLGADMSDVIRTRVFVTDIPRWEAIGRAHGEVFPAHPPATTMVEVVRLIDPDMRVEIEANAVVTT